MKATPGSPIQKPKLEILTSVKQYSLDTHATVEMSNGIFYVRKEFLENPIGTRFAVLFEEESGWFSGEIRQVIVI